MNKTIASILLCAAAACDSAHGSSSRAGGAPDTSPHLSAKSCGLPSGNTDVVAKLGGSFGKVDVCWVYSDGTVRVELDATPKGVLTVAGAKQTVGDDGKAEATVGLDGALLRAPIASAIGDGAGITVPPTDVKFEPPGATPITGTFELSLGDAAAKRTHQLLAAVPTGAALPRTALGPNPPDVVRGSMVALPSEDYEKMTVVGKAAALGQLDLVAVRKDGTRHAAADCGPYDNFGMLPHVDVETTVAVYEATTGKKVAEHTFADGYEGCSMFVSGYAGEKPTVESRPSDASVNDWLGTITAAR
jgi:hypothetical protein